MSELLKVIIIGIVEGITEFLPVSSTGHLIVTTALLQPAMSEAAAGTFEIFIQVGAVLAVILYYRAELWSQVTSVRADRGTQRLWLAIVVAAVPAAVIGILLRGFIKDNLFFPFVVAMALIVGGILLIWIERRPRPAAATETLDRITLRQALIIGVVQTLALIPGTSRSAASIIGAMGAGLSRQAATRFSFFLAIPTLGGATVLDLLLSLDELEAGDLPYFVIGTIVSFVVALLAIHWLLNYVARNTFIPFGIYRIIAGGVILILIAVQIL